MKTLLLSLLLSTAAFAVVNVENFSFEEPAVTDRVWLEGVTNYWDYYGGPFLSNGVGVINEYNSPFCPSLAAADGSQFAFLWCGAGAEIAQTMSGYVSNHTYSVSWAASARGATTGGVLWVLMDAETLARYPLFEEKFIITNIEFTATASNHRLRFFHVGEWDKMIFVDDIHIQETGLPPNPPANLTASQGIYSNKVEITWETYIGDNIVSSEIYRAEINSTNSAIIVSGLPNTNQFADFSAIVNSDYFYWVRVMNNNGWSDFSGSAMGFSTDSDGPIIPTNSLPVDGEHFSLSELPVNLEMEPYFDPAGWPMISIQWQIDDTTNFTYPKWNSGILLTNAVNIEAPTSVLGATNYFRARFKNNRNKWSEWSLSTSFTTEKNLNSPFYFYDTFNNVSGSGNVNKDYTVSGRQYGKVIPVEYSIVGTTEIGDTAVNPNKLTLSGVAACSPNWSFEDSGEFTIDVKINPSADGSAITFGKMSQNLPASGSGGFGIIFYGDASGRYDVYDSATLVGTFTNNVVKSSELQVLLSASTIDFDSDPAYISVTVNNSPLVLKRTWMSEMPTTNLYDRWAYTYAYYKDSGFINNYITLYNYGGDGVYDDLKISTMNTKYSTRTWEDDDDTWIGTSNPVEKFTHAVNINTNAGITVNGLEFVGVGQGTNWLTSDTIPACHGTNWSIFNSSGSMAWYSQNPTLISGDSGLIAERGIYGWSCSVGIILSNLVPNSINVLNIYGYPFETSRSRISYFSGSDGGLFEVDENEFMDKGQIIEYEYTAGSDGTFTIIITPEPAQDYFVYGFSSYLKEISDPEISVVNFLDFGEVAVSKTKSMNLDIFNVGGGIVSGSVSFATIDSFFTVSTNYYYATKESMDTINVMFQPDEEIDYSNTLYLTGSGTNGIVEVLLTGTGVPEPTIFLLLSFGFWICLLAKRK